MAVSLCIHGHFYQPPREDPWLGTILTEGSAAPMRHWNQRILRESYAPLAWARRLDADGHIADILNCYEWINFNAGPTLLRWMRESAPETLKRMQQGDANSKARWGRGNALAQIYHHVIMPLAPADDRAIETKWAIDDFRFHFGRDPEGMWLSECAVDIPTLETLADFGIRYVILAPRQARAVGFDGKNTPVTENSLNVGEPYKVRLPSGKPMIAVFYHGRLSQSIAFEGLLRNGEQFWQRIADEAANVSARNTNNPLLTIATDGETYGHHFTFGEMALAYALAQGYAMRDNIRLTNLSSYLASCPPIREVELHEPSSWSCVHGVERWRSNCGCSDGGHSGWNQHWRGPLREALDHMRAGVKKHYAESGRSCFTDPAGALMAYGEVLADPGKSEAFAERWITGGAKEYDRAWKLLAMQEQSLAAFASCAWFFDDIARIEPENAMTFALRAIELARESGGPNLEPKLASALEKARSNRPGAGSGRDVFEQEVLPRRDDAASFCLMTYLLAQAAKGGKPATGEVIRQKWPEMAVEMTAEEEFEDGSQRGTALIRARHEREGARFVWRMAPASLSRLPDSPFTPLSDVIIYIRPEDASPEAEISRSAGSLARPMRDYLLSHCLENWERFNRSELLAVAAHAASMTGPWPEGQSDVTRPDFWVGFVPYLAVECMVSDYITPTQRRQVEVLLSLHLSKRAKVLAREAVTEVMLSAFEGCGLGDCREPRDDATLSAWAQRVHHVMPDMDWWAVQNKVWELGLAKYPLLSKELGFRV